MVRSFENTAVFFVGLNSGSNYFVVFKMNVGTILIQCSGLVYQLTFWTHHAFSKISLDFGKPTRPLCAVYDIQYVWMKHKFTEDDSWVLQWDSDIIVSNAFSIHQLWITSSHRQCHIVNGVISSPVYRLNLVEKGT